MHVDVAVMRKSTRTFLFTDLEGLQCRSIKIDSFSISTANQINLENVLCRKCNSYFKSCVDSDSERAPLTDPGGDTKCDIGVYKTPR